MHQHLDRVQLRVSQRNNEVPDLKRAVAQNHLPRAQRKGFVQPLMRRLVADVEVVQPSMGADVRAIRQRREARELKREQERLFTHEPRGKLGTEEPIQRHENARQGDDGDRDVSNRV